ncbi:hypothetical protein [uncultured Algibacter sp.]|uniref:hypothetical protein n=1 Tax=uncultured Algibacter sp. TaxID=298659 RepID=UPI00262AC566|nr:hypothetical protein [uncultured Algibacter sp.]
MKNIFKNTKKGILMLALLATISGFASEAKILVNKDSKKTALVLNDVKKGNQISIKDSNGLILYKEMVETTGVYKKGFDLNALPDGNYVFEVEKDLEINTIPFTVNAKEVLFDKGNEETFYKPYTRQEGDLVYLTKLSPNNKPINVSIYANRNDDFELVHSEKIENTKVLERIYKIETGNYKIVINSDSKEYTTFVNN